ncbi:MAG: glycosyltransferase [Chitinispirillia bacterium]|nr:glycosyltransferase [Chitinispirillia bacterium]
MSDIRTEFKSIADALFTNAAGGFAGLPGGAAQKVFVSFCYGPQRARVVRGVGASLKGAFEAAREQAVKFVSRKKALPAWVMVDIVEKEIACTAADLYDVLCRVKPGFLRYGLALDTRYNTAFLEQEVHANSLIKYSNCGYTLHTANITDFLMDQGGRGTGFTFAAPAPDSPVILFEVRSAFYDDGEYVEIESSPASHHKGIRKMNPEQLPDIARKIGAARSVCDDAARFYGLLPSVMFPEMAMFFDSPDKMLYGAYLRRHNFKVRDREAARFLFARPDNTSGGVPTPNSTLQTPHPKLPNAIYHLNADLGPVPTSIERASIARLKMFEAAGIKSKIVTARYNPNLRENAKALGLSDDDTGNVYDFFRAVNRESRESKFSQLIEETFTSPDGELVLEKCYRVENGKPGIMVIKLKYEGTWRCFADEGEFLAFYLDRLPDDKILIDDMPALWGRAAPSSYPIPAAISKQFRETARQIPAGNAPKIIAETRYAGKERLGILITAFAEVVKEVPDAALHLFGYGEDTADEAEVISLASNLGLKDSVKFRGYLTGLPEEYSSSKLFVISGASEGARTALAEAAAYGIPAVVYNVKDELSGAVDDGDTGFTTGESADELADKMLMLLSDPDLHREFSDSAFAKSAEFDESVVMRKWADIFNQHCNGGCADVSVHPSADLAAAPNQNDAASSGIAVSIIIPHYNRAGLLAMCLDSIAVNDYPQELYEVIVVDDCSTENIDSVCAYSKIRNYRFHRLEQNSGHASKPRNYGLSQAIGEYALFIDSDDMISAGLLSGAMKIARQGECDAVMIPKISQRTTAAAFRSLTEDLAKIKLDGYGDLSVLVASDNYSAGKLFRMELIKRFGIHFPETLKYSEDTCFSRWFYAVSDTMGICASESYFVKEWDEGSLSHYELTASELFEHVSFISKNVLAIPAEFASVNKKARTLDSSIKYVAHTLLAYPHYMRRLKERHGEQFAAMRNAPRLSEETRGFIDAVGKAKLLKRNRDRIEIVIMPYRASTWDSLESIWLAAKADPDCDVYVIPVPYSTLKADRKTRDEFRWDGNDLPDYVPVTRYDEYDLSARMPDIIYINDPYDHINTVAPIDPKYHSRALKEHTDMLVFVPYGLYVPPKNPQPNKPFARFPIHDCVDIGTHQFGSFGTLAQHGFPCYSYVGLGSPKIDKIVNTKKEDCALPEGWKNIIGDKKVILYNTHLANTYDRKGDFLARLRSVMGVFKGRGDAVLWWRPHPSTEANIKVHNPDMLDAYRAFVEEFKSSGAGVYDDTPDLHRAIAWSDAYYGDRESSLMYMFGFAGKPIMALDDGVPLRQFSNLYFWGVHDDGENFWFTAQNFNALFKMNKQTWAAEYMGSFPDEKNRPELYGGFAEHNGKLYYSPRRANEIAVYDMKSGVFEKIGFTEPEVEDKNGYYAKPKFTAAIKYKTHIFFIGCAYPAIMRLDTESGALDYFTDWVEPLKELSANDGFHLVGGPVFENKVMLMSLSANAVVVFDMETCVSEVCGLGNRGRRNWGICFDGENCWLPPRFDGPIVKWNPVTREYKEYNNYPAGFKCEQGKPGIGAANIWGGYLWIFPNNANMALKVDIKDGSMAVLEGFSDEREINGERVFPHGYITSRVIEEKIYLHNGRTNHFMEYDRETGRLRDEGIAFTEENAQKLAESYPLLFSKDIKSCADFGQCIFYESLLFRLPGFLNYIVNDYCWKKDLRERQIELIGRIAVNADGTCGKKVHEYVKKAVQTGARNIY